MQRNLRTWQAIAVATQFGVALAVAVGLGIFMGNAIDGWLGLQNAPVFTMIGVLVGLSSAIATMVKTMRKLSCQEIDAPAEKDKDRTE
ncbi:MAG: AtpZ/AtpI family protein [Chloroflexota bacterium]